MRRRRRMDLFKTSMGAVVQGLALICLVIIVYIIGSSIMETSPSAKKETQKTTSTQKEKTTKENSDKTTATSATRASTQKKTESTTKKTTSTTETTSTKNNTSFTNTSRQQGTTATTQDSTQATISTQYGPETNQDGNSVEWISQQKDVIDLEKDNYELRSKGKSGIQYIDANGDVAKVLLQPEDSVDGKSYEEYYYQGDELIYASIWSASGDGLGEQYYYNNGNLIQWVDSDGLIYNKETRGSGFESSSDWEKYLSAGTKAMRLSESGSSLSSDSSSEDSSSTTGISSTDTSNRSSTSR